MKPIRSIRVWWNPNLDRISLGEFLVQCAHEFCDGNTKTVDLVVDQTSLGASVPLPDLNFRVSREDDKTIIERVTLR